MGSITGLTVIDFFSLPAWARLSIVLESDSKAEGFLALKKL